MTQASSSAHAVAAASLAVDVLTGNAAPPSANGELAFASPHEARLFGMAHSLVHAGVFDWDTFRASLIVALAESAGETQTHEKADVQADPSLGMTRASLSAPAYYRCFGQALERLLAERNLVAEAELSMRTEVLAARPSGHDHDHDDSHDHAARRGG